jgi:transcriptional regulator with XRE-family HTH domain
MDKKKFGAKLKLIRKSKRLTQEDVVANIDFAISIAAYSRIERGDSAPKLENIELIAEGLGIDKYELYSDYLHLLNNVPDLLKFIEKMKLELNQVRLARKSLNKCIRIIKKEGNQKDLIITLFQVVIWKHMVGASVHPNFISYIVKHFKLIPKNQFYDLCRQVWEACYDKRKFEFFLSIIEKVIQDISDDPDRLMEIWFWYALANYFNKKYIPALVGCEKSLSYRTDNSDIIRVAWTLNLHGNTYLQIKQYDKAINCYKENIQLYNDKLINNERLYTYAHLNTGRSYFLQRKYDEAKKHWEVANKILVDDIEVLNILTDKVYAEYYLGNISQAKKDQEQIVKKLNHITEKDHFKYTEWIGFYLRNSGLLLKDTDPINALEEYFRSAEYICQIHYKDEIVDLFYHITDLIGRHGIRLTTEQLTKLQLLRDNMA